MINHYRTLLLNQADLGDPNEFISPGYSALTLPAPLLNFYSLLYPKGSTRAYQQFIEYYCETLLHSANQTQFLTSFDPRVTYTLDQLAPPFSIQPSSFDYPTFYNKFANGGSTVTNMLSYGAVDTTSQNLWQQHFNTVYSLAGLINAYVVKVNAICQT